MAHHKTAHMPSTPTLQQRPKKSLETKAHIILAQIRNVVSHRQQNKRQQVNSFLSLRLGSLSSVARRSRRSPYAQSENASDFLNHK